MGLTALSPKCLSDGTLQMLPILSKYLGFNCNSMWNSVVEGCETVKCESGKPFVPLFHSTSNLTSPLWILVLLYLNIQSCIKATFKVIITNMRAMLIEVLAMMAMLIIILCPIKGGSRRSAGSRRLWGINFSGGGRRLAVTDGEGSLHNSSCTLLIEMPKEINCYRKVLGAF